MTKSHSNQNTPAYDRPTPARPNHALLLKDARVHRGLTASQIQTIVDAGDVSQHKKRAIERGYAIKNAGPRYADINESVPVLGDVFARGTALTTATPTITARTSSATIQIGYVHSNIQRGDKAGDAHAMASEILAYDGQRVNWTRQIKSIIVQKIAGEKYHVIASTLRRPKINECGDYESSEKSIVQSWVVLGKPDILSNTTASANGCNVLNANVIPEPEPVYGPYVKPWEVE